MADIKVKNLKIQGSDGNFYEFEGGEGESNYGLPIKIAKIKDYQYDLDYSDIDYVYFEDHKDEAQISPKKLGACTSFWYDGFYGRNLDWAYNKDIEFVVKTPKREGYFGSISVCGGLTDLTRSVMEDGTVNRNSFKLLPFFVRDGINTEGLVCSMNVVPTYNKETISPEVEERHSINSKNLTRFILDRFSTADEAIEYVKSYVKLTNEKTFQDGGYDLHWMIADRNNCYWLETTSTGNWISEQYDTENKKYAILTNFHLNTIDWDTITGELDGKFPTPANYVMGKEPTSLGVDEFGSGLERYNIIVDAINVGISSKTDISAAMKSVKYSSLYNSNELDFDHTYLTELVGDYTEQGGSVITVDTAKDSFQDVWNAACANWESYIDDEARRDQPDGLLWHTTHTTCIDISDKSLNIYFDENYTTYSSYKIEVIKSSGVEIDDESIVSDKTWSSQKINDSLSDSRYISTADELKEIIEETNNDSLIKRNVFLKANITLDVSTLDEEKIQENPIGNEGNLKIQSFGDKYTLTLTGIWNQPKLLKCDLENIVIEDQTDRSLYIAGRDPGSTAALSIAESHHLKNVDFNVKTNLLKDDTIDPGLDTIEFTIVKNADLVEKVVINIDDPTETELENITSNVTLIGFGNNSHLRYSSFTGGASGRTNYKKFIGFSECYTITNCNVELNSLGDNDNATDRYGFYQCSELDNNYASMEVSVDDSNKTWIYYYDCEIMNHNSIVSTDPHTSAGDFVNCYVKSKNGEKTTGDALGGWNGRDNEVNPKYKIFPGDIVLSDLTIKSAKDIESTDLSNTYGVVAAVEGDNLIIVPVNYTPESVAFASLDALWTPDLQKTNRDQIPGYIPTMWNSGDKGTLLGVDNTKELLLKAGDEMVKTISTFTENDFNTEGRYPAFDKCKEYSNGKPTTWFMPSLMALLYINYNFNKINETLLRLGCDVLPSDKKYYSPSVIGSSVSTDSWDKLPDVNMSERITEEVLNAFKIHGNLDDLPSTLSGKTDYYTGESEETGEGSYVIPVTVLNTSNLLTERKLSNGDYASTVNPWSALQTMNYVDSKIDNAVGNYEKFVVLGIYGSQNAIGIDESPSTYYDISADENRIFVLDYTDATTTKIIPLSYCAPVNNGIDDKADMNLALPRSGQETAMSAARANEPLHSDDRNTYIKSKGIHLPLGNLIIRAIPDDYGVIIIPVADHEATITDLASTDTDTSLYNTLVNSIKSVLDLNPENIFAGVVMNFGDKDIEDETPSITWQSNLTNMLGRFLSDMDSYKTRTSRGYLSLKDFFFYESPKYYKKLDNNGLLGDVKTRLGINYIMVPEDTATNDTEYYKESSKNKLWGQNSYRTVIAPLVFDAMLESGVFQSNRLNNNIQLFKTNVANINDQIKSLQMEVQGLKEWTTAPQDEVVNVGDDLEYAEVYNGSDSSGELRKITTLPDRPYLSNSGIFFEPDIKKFKFKVPENYTDTSTGTSYSVPLYIVCAYDGEFVSGEVPEVYSLLVNCSNLHPNVPLDDPDIQRFWVNHQDKENLVKKNLNGQSKETIEAAIQPGDDIVIERLSNGQIVIYSSRGSLTFNAPSGDNFRFGIIQRDLTTVDDVTDIKGIRVSKEKESETITWTYKGAWRADVTYQKGDIVFYTIE